MVGVVRVGIPGNGCVGLVPLLHPRVCWILDDWWLFLIVRGDSNHRSVHIQHMVACGLE
jgi:hypothetical protein